MKGRNLQCLRAHLHLHFVSDDTAMILVMLFSLKTMESLENGLQSHSVVTLLFSMTALSLASSQSCYSVDS